MPELASPWRVSVAPMMDWTDRHCRFFHRLITRHTRLYTEMVTTGALLHGDLPRHLDFDAAEHPLALQVGGSEPADLAQAARLARQWGYDEININCGCPSERVQRGAFGACLMAEPHTVRDGVAAMRDVLGNDLPVTVKHRIGIDRGESYGFVRDFVGTLAERGGCTVMCRAIWTSTPKNTRWRCNWAAVSRPIWLPVRVWRSSGVTTRSTSTAAAPARGCSVARLAPA